MGFSLEQVQAAVRSAVVVATVQAVRPVAVVAQEVVADPEAAAIHPPRERVLRPNKDRAALRRPATIPATCSTAARRRPSPTLTTFPATISFPTIR